MAETAREAAFAAAQELLDDDVEAPDTDEVQASSEAEPVADDEPQEADEGFTLDPEVPDDIRALVEEPDFEAEAEEELEASEDEEWAEDEYVDPRLAEERKKRLAAEKKAAHYEKLRVKDARKQWEDEAAKFYPLANAKKIEATSRRGFLRAAKAQHEENKPFVLAAVERERAALAAERDQMEANIRAELEQAWGRPIAGSSQVPERVPEKKETIDKVFKTKGFHAGVREMLRQGE